MGRQRAVNKRKRSISDIIKFPGSPRERIITRGSMRGKRVGTYRQIPVGPIQAGPTGNIGRRSAKYRETVPPDSLADRLRAVQREFYNLEG
jgi:hypothetical protein